MPRMKMGRLIKVPNKQAKFGSNPFYFCTKLEHGDSGEEVYALFTQHELDRAIERAAKNPEDVVTTSRLADFFD